MIDSPDDNEFKNLILTPATYAKLLRHPKWQKRRLEIMERDGFRCFACGDDKNTLTVHHKRYNGLPWNSWDDDLQTLCQPCHSALGKHSRGGVYYELDALYYDTEEEKWVGKLAVVYECCQVCGNNFDDSHSGVIEFECGHFFGWGDGGSVYGKPMLDYEWQATINGFPAFLLSHTKYMGYGN
jgi:hypothetical protein